MSGQWVADVLTRLGMAGQSPSVILVDNGPEFTSKALDEWAYRNGVHLEFIWPGKSVENAYIESFNASLRKECLNSHWFHTLEEAKQTIESWRGEYDQVRPHNSLGNLSPGEHADNHDQQGASEASTLTLEAVQLMGADK